MKIRTETSDESISVDFEERWYQDDRLTGGLSALYPIGGGINLSGEYSDNDGLALGFLGTYQNFSGLLYWLDRYDDLFVSVNCSLLTW